MLETVREYGAGKLAERGDGEDMWARQVEYYVALAQQYRREGFGPRQLEWVAQLRREHANLRAVLDHCRSRPAGASQMLAIAASLILLAAVYFFLDNPRAVRPPPRKHSH